jgi:hypothetical protein
MAGFSAGCSGLPPLGSAVRYGDVNVPKRNLPTYRKWLPAPTEVPDDSEMDESYDVMVYDPPAGGDPTWARQSIARSIVLWHADYVGVHVDDVDLAVAGENMAVPLGDINPAAVAETVEETSYEPSEAIGEYDCYDRDEERVVAVGGDALVFGNGTAARDVVAATVGAAAGDVAGYHQTDSDFTVLSDEAGYRRWAWLVPRAGAGTWGNAEGVRGDTIGWATAFDHDANGVYYVETWLFPTGYEITDSAIKSSLNQRDRALDARAVDVTTGDRTATIEMRLRRDSFREEYGVGSYLVPHVTWRATRDADAQRVSFHHEGGDAVRTARLRVDGPGAEPISDFPDIGERVEAGESVSVPTMAFDEEGAVRLAYVSVDGNRSASLYDYHLR